MNAHAPLVSIGIPTFNRAALIARAIDSALNQDYSNVEVLISDNASTDGTAGVCQAYAARHPRVRYLKQPVNLGPTQNFRTVLHHASGEYFMWLGDDDWIDADYVSCTLRALQADPQVALASGVPIYYVSGVLQHHGRVFSVLSPQRLLRLLRYYWNVSDNGTFYGLMRRTELTSTPPANSMGGDWFLIANFAARGKILMLDGTAVHRELGGATTSYEQIARVLGLSSWHARFPFLSIARSAGADVLWHGPAFRELAWWHRLTLAVAVFGCILAKAAKSQLSVRKSALARFCRRWIKNLGHSKV